jgi:hypothetical protein
MRSSCCRRLDLSSVQIWRALPVPEKQRGFFRSMFDFGSKTDFKELCTSSSFIS